MREAIPYGVEEAGAGGSDEWALNWTAQESEGSARPRVPEPEWSETAGRGQEGDCCRELNVGRSCSWGKDTSSFQEEHFYRRALKREDVIRSQYGWEETGGAWLIMWAGCSEADPEEDSRAFSRVLVVTVKVIFFNHSILKVESLDYC